MLNSTLYPILQAILAAALFGASAPFAKLLLGEISPIPLASFLYLGSGLGLALFRMMQKFIINSSVEAQISKADIPWLMGAIMAGGIAAPITLMMGLKNTPASTASLLLNLEGVATTLLGGLIFREAIGRRVWLGIMLVTLASMVLSFNTGGDWGISWGALGVIGACVLWGIDNNLTRNISAKDPLIIVTVKGLAAGSFSLILALALKEQIPSISIVLKSMVLGLLSYGLSIVFFILAMRGLGAARTSAYFGMAPFVGVVLSFIIFREAPHSLLFLALPFMLTGALLLLTEDHSHRHIHAEFSHEHRHTHKDQHHMHIHADDPGFDPSITHTHIHRHEYMEHDHPHTPDLHHRHKH
jgi:drug/metabolite transporter (DMT)-like permease